MSTLTPSDMSDPDRNLATSFVALAEGVSVASVSNNVAEPTISTTTTTFTDSTNRNDEETETVQAIVEGTPINEFTHLAQILSYAFPVEFPFGVTKSELGSNGTVLKRVLRRLTRVYDGRVAHNYILLMYVANLAYRHAALTATSARVNM